MEVGDVVRVAHGDQVRVRGEDAVELGARHSLEAVHLWTGQQLTNLHATIPNERLVGLETERVSYNQVAKGLLTLERGDPIVRKEEGEDGRCQCRTVVAENEVCPGFAGDAWSVWGRYTIRRGYILPEEDVPVQIWR